MNLRQVKAAALNEGADSVVRLGALASTERHRELVAKALSTVSSWLKLCERPAISCGGGKDSTATTLLVLSQAPSTPIYCADPPNPLPDRSEYLERLQRWLGREFIRVSYDWDVETVLRGDMAYPDGLKIRRLRDRMADHDGVALGMRARESHARSVLAAVRGEIYRLKSGEWRCLPILRWTAEDVLAYLVSTGCPINPVYEKTLCAPSWEHLRDGTWWPRLAVQREHEPWIRAHYPEIADMYARAVLVERARPSEYHVM